MGWTRKDSVSSQDLEGCFPSPWGDVTPCVRGFLAAAGVSVAPTQGRGLFAPCALAEAQRLIPMELIAGQPPVHSRTALTHVLLSGSLAMAFAPSKIVRLSFALQHERLAGALAMGASGMHQGRGCRGCIRHCPAQSHDPPPQRSHPSHSLRLSGVGASPGVRRGLGVSVCLSGPGCFMKGRTCLLSIRHRILLG